MAYANVTPKLVEFDLKKILIERKNWRINLVNDFETALFPEFPELKKLKEQLYLLGAEYVSMSGSGSSFFAFFKEKPDGYDFPKSYSIIESEYTI